MPTGPEISAGNSDGRKRSLGTAAFPTMPYSINEPLPSGNYSLPLCGFTAGLGSALNITLLRLKPSQCQNTYRRTHSKDNSQRKQAAAYGTVTCQQPESPGCGEYSADDCQRPGKQPGRKHNAGKHNGVPGDLLILVEEEPHQDLIRDENDLIYNLLLSFPTAALGGAVEIPTIDGKVKVKIDSGTQPGKVLRLRGKGLPNVNGYGTGDLLVNISIYVPEALNKEEKSTLEKMEASDNFKPNTSVKEKIFKKFKSFFD